MAQNSELSSHEAIVEKFKEMRSHIPQLAGKLNDLSSECAVSSTYLAASLPRHTSSPPSLPPSSHRYHPPYARHKCGSSDIKCCESWHAYSLTAALGREEFAVALLCLHLETQSATSNNIFLWAFRAGSIREHGYHMPERVLKVQCSTIEKGQG